MATNSKRCTFCKAIVDREKAKILAALFKRWTLSLCVQCNINCARVKRAHAHPREPYEKPVLRYHHDG